MRHQASVVALRLPRNIDNSQDPAGLTWEQLLEQMSDQDADVHEEAVVSIEAARVRSFVRRLPILERKVITARYGLLGEQLSCRQLATRLGISLGNVAAIEQRALDELRGMYGLPDAA